jgi:hypothetical protein
MEAAGSLAEMSRLFRRCRAATLTATCAGSCGSDRGVCESGVAENPEEDEDEDDEDEDE